MSRPLRVALLTSGMTGYLDAQLCALADRGVEMFIAARRHRDNVAYDKFGIPDRAVYWSWEEEPSPAAVVERVRQFDPDVVMMHSWEFGPYRAALKDRRGRSIRVLWMDNNWLETPKQWAGRLTAQWYLAPVFDVAFLPGDRTEAFARRLGFDADRVIRGSLSADTSIYYSEPVEGKELKRRARFLSALRMVHHKGADVLAEAYAEYRTLVKKPWQLDVVGVGPLLDAFDGIAGVTSHGFVQPEDLAGLMRRSSCYVNASRAEPYGVVLHEAAASALPILTSDLVGAAPTMVQDGYNGWWVESGRPDLLARAMARTSELEEDRLTEMSSISRALSHRISPAGWARNLHEDLARRLARPGT